MGPQHSDLLVTLKHCHPANACSISQHIPSWILAWLNMSCLDEVVIMDSTETVLCLLDHLLTLWPHLITFTYFTDALTWDQQREKRPLREVNNIATVTQGFCRLNVSITQTLISLSVHHVRWGWLRTQNEGCLSCIAMLCGHNPLTKRGNLSLHGSLEMPERLPSWFSMTRLKLPCGVYLSYFPLLWDTFRYVFVGLPCGWHLFLHGVNLSNSLPSQHNFESDICVLCVLLSRQGYCFRCWLWGYLSYVLSFCHNTDYS